MSLFVPLVLTRRSEHTYNGAAIVLDEEIQSL